MSKHQLCKFLASNIEISESYNFLKISFVFFSTCGDLELFYSNCDEISIKGLLEYILETLKLTHDFFHNNWILSGVSHPGMSKLIEKEMCQRRVKKIRYD